MPIPLEIAGIKLHALPQMIRDDFSPESRILVCPPQISVCRPPAGSVSGKDHPEKRRNAQLRFLWGFRQRASAHNVVIKRRQVPLLDCFSPNRGNSRICQHAKLTAVSSIPTAQPAAATASQQQSLRPLSAEKSEGELISVEMLVG